jgi:4'-phosphopantetheinyl transferase
MSIAQNAVEVLFVSIDVTPSVLAQLSSVLTPAESDRAARFHFEVDRRRSIVARAALRHLLSRHLDIEPRQFCFELGESGKPFLPQSDIKFNISHSGDVVAIALAADKVGIDIEAKHEIAEMAALAARFFSRDEAERVRAARDASDQFFRIWTMKEAIVKSAGLGLGLPLDCFTVPASASAPEPIIPAGDAPISADWFVVELDVREGYSGAVAARGADWRVFARWESAQDLTSSRLAAQRSTAAASSA